MAPRKTQFNCTVEGCGRSARTRNLCDRHYKTLKRHGDPSFTDKKIRERLKPCKLSECNNERYANGYCIRHNSARGRYGDPEAVDKRREERNPLGKKFGRFTVLSDLGTRTVGKRKNIKRYVVVRCDCGSEPREVEISTLLSGKSQSCGCLHKEIKQKAPGVAAVSYLFNRYKAGATKRNLAFEISKEQFTELVLENCHYCGGEPFKDTAAFSEAARQNFNGNIKWNGVDRKNSSIGYTVENCVTACSQCNLAKRDTPYNEFIEWIGRVYDHTRK